MILSTCRSRIDTGGTADLDDVMTVMGEAFDPSFGEAWTQPQCSGVLGMAGCWLVIARDDDGPTGFALARTIAGEAELLLLAVRPGWRRGGIGAHLLARIIADARTGGARWLHLEVRETNSALSLYGRAGFEQVGRRKGYYRGAGGQSFDALTYRRSLDRDRRNRAAGEAAESRLDHVRR